MGDRGNLVMVESTGKEIYFYTHWDGYNLPSILQAALKRGKGRWEDETYLARIILSEMIQHSVLDNTGYGISTYETDKNHANIYVKSTTKQVMWKDQIWSFQEFVNLINPIPDF